MPSPLVDRVVHHHDEAEFRADRARALVVFGHFPVVGVSARHEHGGVRRLEAGIGGHEHRGGHVVSGTRLEEGLLDAVAVALDDAGRLHVQVAALREAADGVEPRRAHAFLTRLERGGVLCRLHPRRVDCAVGGDDAVHRAVVHFRVGVKSLHDAHLGDGVFDTHGGAPESCTGQRGRQGRIRVRVSCLHVPSPLEFNYLCGVPMPQAGISIS